MSSTTTALLRRTALIVLTLAFVACGGVTSSGTPVSNLGRIIFGTTWDRSSLTIISQQSSFKAGDQIAWRAELREPAKAAALRWVVSKKSGASETTVIDQSVSVGNPDFDVFGNQIELGALLDGPGDYVMRYYRDTTLLAEGAFSLTA
jgi:hypothetical protein